MDFSPEHSEYHQKSGTYDKFNHTFYTIEDDRFEGPETYYAGWSAISSSVEDEYKPSQYCHMTIVGDDPAMTRR